MNIGRGRKGKVRKNRANGMEPNFQTVEPWLIEDAKENWIKGDILAVLICMPNTRNLRFVWDNFPILKERGFYEVALLHSWTITRTNYSGWPVSAIEFLFQIADRKRLREAGDPLPGDGPFTVFRGVSGNGAKRRVRGISWTASLERAVWFAKRFPFEKPTVFKAIVGEPLIYAFCNDRDESEFLCDIPRSLKIEKVWPPKGMQVEQPKADARKEAEFFLRIE
jgi:hypothetical protein